MKSPLLLLLCILSTLTGSAQLSDLYLLEAGVSSGNLHSLALIGNYLDSNKKVIDHLGHHRIESTLRKVALRMLNEHTLFLEDELALNEKTTADDFRRFFEHHKDRIRYSSLSETFLITAEEKRSTSYKLRKITPQQDKVAKKMVQEKKYDREIRQIIESHDPLILLHLGSMVFRHRSRWDVYYFDEDIYTNLVAALTGLEVLVPYENDTTIGDQYDHHLVKSPYNYMIYWVTHYSDYEWSVAENRFINRRETPLDADPFLNLVHMMSDPVDSIAMNAFLLLSESPPDQVAGLPRNLGSDRGNYTLPTFHVQFLWALSQLTAYCRASGITYKNDPVVDSYIQKLQQAQYPSPFIKKYQLENEVIAQLRLDHVTAFEYAALVKERDYNLSYSAGRILDKFYSRHWPVIMKDSAQLRLYLKKIALFSRLGIIGNCNLYAAKFWRSDPALLAHIHSLSLQERDSDFRKAEQLILQKVQLKEKTSVDRKRWEADEDYIVPHFTDSIRHYAGLLVEKTAEDADDAYEVKGAISKVLSSINYKDIPGAVRALSPVPDSLFDKKSFLERDFGLGFSVTGYESLTSFLARYESMDEYQLYAYYVKEAGTDIMNDTGNLDYKKIYQVLKYDIVDALAGGGGSARNFSIYPIIKLLELHFKTTLGFSAKLCHNQGMWYCDTRERAICWIQFLRKKDLIPHVDPEAPSFLIPLE